jgi:ABC-type transport system involved in cytochrome bd biosynthesis fused ATPase/permease subunit
MTVGANVFRINCRNDTYVSSNSIFAYGGPILYLFIQICFLSWLLLWLERGSFPSLFKRRGHSQDEELELRAMNADVEDEKVRVQNTSTDPLRISQITKRYGDNLAVDHITFGVSQGEVFALLGPNGAGKTSTIDMIRGESKPDEGTILLNGMNIVNDMRMARKHLGGTFDCDT